MTETFIVIFAFSFICGALVLLLSPKIVGIIVAGNSVDASLIQMACVRGMFKALRMAQSVALADNNSKRVQYFVFVKYVQVAA